MKHSTKRIPLLLCLLALARLANGQGTLNVGSGTTVTITTGTTVVLEKTSIVNNGAIAGNSGSTVLFSGNASSSLSGTGSSAFDQLTLQTGTGNQLTLQQNISVGGTLTFITGRLNLGNYVADLGNSGQLSGESETARAYTTGGGYLRRVATLNAPAAAAPGALGILLTSSANLGSTEIRRYGGAQSVAGAGSSIQRYFTVQPSQNSGLNATVQFNYFDAELNAVPEAELSLWRQNGASWLDLGASARDAATSSVTQQGLATLGTFTLARGNIGLATPVVETEASVVCSGGSAPLSISGGPSLGSVSITTNGSNAQDIQLDANGAASFTSGPLTQNSTISIATVSNGSTTSAGNSSVTITVNSVLLNALSSQTVCNGAATATLTLTGAPAGSSYSWTNDNTTIGLAASGNGDIGSFAAINNGNAPVVAHISATASYTLGGVTCASAPQTASITVNPGFAASISYSGSPYCSSTGTAIPQLSGSAGGTYSASPAGISIDAATGAIDLAASTPGTYTVSYSAGTGCGASASTQVAIRPATFINPLPNSVLCNGAVYGAVTLSGAYGLSFSWSASNPAIGIGASGAGTIPSFTATNSGTTSISSYVYVEASGGTGCDLKRNMIFRITVQPTPVINAVANQVLCSGAQSPGAVFSSSIAGTTISWTNSYPGIGLHASGTGSIPPFIVQNNSGLQQTATITATSVAGGCVGAPVSFTITVSPAAGQISYPQASYCPASWAYVRRTGSSGGTYSAVPAGLALDAADGSINLGASAPGHYTITYTVAAGGCSGTASTQLTVLPQATVNPIGNQVYCAGMLTAPLPFTGTATSYAWTNSNPAIGLAASGTGTSLPAFTAVNPGPGVQYAYVRVTPLGNGSSNCPGRGFSFRIAVNDCPPVTGAVDPGGDAARLRAALSAGPNPAREQLTVVYSGKRDGLTVEIRDGYGIPRSIPRKLSAGSSRLSVGTLLPGTYFVVVRDDAGGIQVALPFVKL